MGPIATREARGAATRPAVRRSIAPGSRASEVPRTRRGVGSRRGRDVPARLLVLAGDAETADLRAQMSRRAGHDAIPVVWPVDLLGLLDTHGPDVVLLVVEPHDTWGLEVAGDLKLLEGGRNLPVVVVVLGEPTEELVERTLRAGADDVVRGAVGAGELGARVAVQLRNKRQLDQMRALRHERDDFKVRATVDPLTKVLNRGALEEAIANELARGEPLAVMFVDLDHFKKVNDTFGHDVGDTVLRSLGAYLRRSIRGNDIAGRYGGEEFVVCLSGCDPEVAPRIAERHREQIAQIKFPEKGHPERITASIGVAVFDPDVPDPSMGALLKRADAAVYEAKHTGRNRVVVAPRLARSPTEQSSADLAEAISKSIIPGPPRSRKPRPADALEAELVRQINAGHGTLPVIPAVAMAALRMARKPSVDIGSLAKLAGECPFIAARFLAVGNSALFCRAGRTVSVRDAMVRIGLDGTRDVLSSIAYGTTLPKYHDLLERCSERAIVAAKAAKAVCRELGLRYEPAYLCGLLHDLGEARVLRILSALPTPPGGSGVILALVQKYHTRAGAQLAEKWSLHSDIVQACTLHHDASQATSLPVRIAMVSDLFVKLAARGPNAKLDEKSAEECARFGVTGTMVNAVLRACL
jgi:diguanylate cyclase (GGDEF)-like protein/putative nucleotidyltransferase with HDIG domain